MGMDLLAQNEDARMDQYHLQSSGWRKIGDILEELGCDVTSMTGWNNGQVVDAATSCDWAAALREGLRKGRIYKMEHPHASRRAGWRSEYHVDGTLTPVPNRYVPDHLLLDSLINPDGFMLTKGRSKRARKVRINEGRVEYEWLSEIATFFADSGGFEQW